MCVSVCLCVVSLRHNFSLEVLSIPLSGFLDAHTVLYEHIMSVLAHFCMSLSCMSFSIGFTFNGNSFYADRASVKYRHKFQLFAD